MSFVSGVYGSRCDRGPEVPAGVRRRAFVELAGIVAAAMVVQLLAVRVLGEPGWFWASAGVQLCVPMLAALSLRRVAGPRMYVVAAILMVGLVVPLFIQEPTAWARGVASNAMVAAAMVWLLGSDQRSSTASVIAAAIILALAMIAAQMI